jgi:1-acyl-sn-glycerol-3-phosphate acyltransferase
LWSPGFQGLLWTNFLTAINDNIFRWFVVGIGKQLVPSEYAFLVLALGLVAFVLPYLLLAASAGWLADRFKKRNVIVACKIAEIVVMSIGMLAVLSGSLVFLMITVFLMGAQSALFAPSKVGTIPELLDEDKISTGNGWFNLSSLTATIIGMLVGAWLADLAGKTGMENLWLTAAVVIGTAIVGTLVSLLIVSQPAANPKLKYPYNLVTATWRDLKLLASDGKIFRVALGIAFFWSFAALGQTNIDSFARESGGIFEMERMPLLLSLILGVGGGSILAGIASRGQIELGLVPWGCIGMIIFSICLWLAPNHFIDGTLQSIGLWVSCAFLFFLGISAGFFDVPLASYIQHHSPVEKRGQILAANNFMLFSAMLFIAVSYLALQSPAHIGSLANLQPKWSVAKLNVGDQRIVEKTRVRFENDLAENPEADWKAFLPAAESELYPHTAAALMHADMKSEKARISRSNADRKPGAGEAFEMFSTDEYLEGLEGDEKQNARLVEHVNRQAGLTPWLTSRQIFLVMALVALPVLGYTAWRVRQSMVRIALIWLIKILYRYKIKGLENIPEKGPAVLIANHSSWLDAMLMLLIVNRKMRTIAWAGNFQWWPLKKWAEFCDVILISGGPKSIRKGLQDARDALDSGELVCLFPEGGISKTCQIRKFKPGLLKVLDKDHRHVPLVPVYLDEIWGTAASFSENKFFLKRPRSFRHPVTVHVGEPIQCPDNMYGVRQHMQEMGANIVPDRQGPFRSPTQQFVRQCKRRKFKFKAGDSTGTSATGGNLLMRTMILSRLLKRSGISDEKNVGVLIPPTVGGVIVNAALAVNGNVSVNLNYSVSNEIMNGIVEQAGIKCILTTRKIMEKFDFEFDAEIKYLDDFKEQVTTGDKIAGVMAAYVTPASMLEKQLGINNANPDDLLTMVFTSGSTGVPKGVMLSNGNIANNVDGINKVAKLRSSDVMVGVLPFFHSFGYTVTMWGAMANNVAACYHFNPLDAKQVGKMVKKFQGTLLLATPTFLRTYAKRCTPEEFKSLNLVVAGAERLPPEMSDTFEKKFSVRPVEGYGATELSPLVSVNVPKSRQSDPWQIDLKEGTVGRPIPNVAARITDLDSGEVLGVNESGMLWIKGPNVMMGYLHKPDLTAEVVQDGWYKTGDVALIDDDGFIKITGRISRFSKIGGEMVPHVKIEEVLMRLIEDDDEVPNIAVTAVPDVKKGERLIVLHTEIPKTIDELRKGLSEAGLPNIFIPSADSFKRVDVLPILGSGKVDLKGLKAMAEEHYS